MPNATRVATSAARGGRPRDRDSRVCAYADAPAQIRPRARGLVRRRAPSCSRPGLHLNCKSLNKKSKLGTLSKPACVLAGASTLVGCVHASVHNMLAGSPAGSRRERLCLSGEDGAGTHTSGGFRGNLLRENKRGGRNPTRRCIFRLKSDCPSGVPLEKFHEN